MIVRNLFISCSRHSRVRSNTGNRSTSRGYQGDEVKSCFICSLAVKETFFGVVCDRITLRTHSNRFPVLSCKAFAHLEIRLI